MTYNDYEYLKQIQNHWLKQKQLIRKKYQIPYNITYISKPCSNQTISIPSQPKSFSKRNKLNATRNTLKEKYPDIPPMHCLKCHLDLTACLCQNGLGEWWKSLSKKTRSIGVYIIHL